MAILKVPYTNLKAVLNGIRTQVIDSYSYCQNKMPRFDNPEQMFKNLKLLITYKSDPSGTELLQSVPTLFENNYHGIRGAGDCDCFVILWLAMCKVHGWNDNKIVLAGRNKINPVHIYCTIRYGNETFNADLTQPYFNTIRPYKYLQHIPI